jgi:hypothetical protein
MVGFSSKADNFARTSPPTVGLHGNEDSCHARSRQALWVVVVDARAPIVVRKAHALRKLVASEGKVPLVARNFKGTTELVCSLTNFMISTWASLRAYSYFVRTPSMIRAQFCRPWRSMRVAPPRLAYVGPLSRRRGLTAKDFDAAGRMA